MFMNRARMVVCPSLAEGFGLPPLEAMACGTPVIASRIPAIEEVCADAAVLVDPLDVEGLACTMEHILKDEALSEELVRNGLRRSAQFTWEGTAARLLEVYKTAYELGLAGPESVRQVLMRQCTNTQLEKRVSEITGLALEELFPDSYPR